MSIFLQHAVFVAVVLILIRDHSFSPNVEFWAKPRNLPVSVMIVQKSCIKTN